MNKARGKRKELNWDDLPASRRHLYFYIMLTLATILVATLYDAMSPKKPAAPPPSPPPAAASR